MAFDVHPEGDREFTLRNILEDAGQLKLMWSPQIAGVNLNATYGIHYDCKFYTPYTSGRLRGVFDLQLCEIVSQRRRMDGTAESDVEAVYER